MDSINTFENDFIPYCQVVVWIINQMITTVKVLRVDFDSN